MATADTVAQEANDAYADAKALADDSLLKVDAALGQAATAINAMPSAGVSGAFNPDQVTTAEIDPPQLPTTDFATDVRDAFDYAFGTFNQQMQSQILNFLDTFFPDVSDAVKNNSDTWIADTILNGRYVPIAVETAIWNRAKDREVIEAGRAEQSIIDATGSRGFAAPTGTLAFTVAANQQELAKKLTGINREITIKAFDVANENTKFAVQQAVSLRTAFVAAMGDFIKVAMVQPNNAVEYAKVILAAKTSLYDSAVRLYSAQIDEEKLRTTVALENNVHDLKYQDINRQAYGDFLQVKTAQAKLKADTAMSAADQLAKLATGALSTRNTMVSVSAGV